MRLCKALLCRSARPGQYGTSAICSSLAYSTTTTDTPDAPRKRGRPRKKPIEAIPEPQPLASNRDDAFTINPDKKTVTTAVGDLALSPIMDPMFWEAKQRHQIPKAKPSKPKNSVGRQLRANAYARALATPVRMCVITRARMPSFFLQDFNLVANPETGAPWLLPQSIMPDEPEPPNTKGISEALDEAGAEEEEEERAIAAAAAGEEVVEDEAKLELASSSSAQELTTTTPASTTTATATSPNLNESQTPQGRSVYVLARQDLLSGFGLKGSPFEKSPIRLAGADPAKRHIMGKVVWRQDMDRYIVNAMRQNIVDGLLYLNKLCATMGRHYLVRCWGWDDVKYKHSGSILWFRPSSLSGEGEESSANANPDAAEPGPFATFDVQKTDIQGEIATTTLAVYNMDLLLGPEYMKQFRDNATAMSEGNIFMLAGRRTVDLQAKLWKLQGYLDKYP